VDEPSSLEETLTGMAEITGIAIPPEEMADTNIKLVSSGTKERKEKETREKAAAAPVEDAAMALNSVASLFSSLPGMSAAVIGN